MKNILLSAYACDPTKGSEDGNGYHWASGLQKVGNKVVCITRCKGKLGIEKQEVLTNLNFVYLDLPFGMEKLYNLSRPTMYLHYILWQWFAFLKAKKMHQTAKFDVVHHVTWGSLQLGSFMYLLKIPFIFGPAGGGQVAPKQFKHYFKEYWAVEVKREITSKVLMYIHPGIKTMLQQAKQVLLSNPETVMLAKSVGATHTSLVLDAAVDDDFFPTGSFKNKKSDAHLKLLWVGRLLPRKGILLVTEVMELLKEYTDISLTIVGDGEMRKHLEQDIQARGLKNVNYVGSVPFSKVNSYYANHDLFFFTSLRDSCPIQLIEAMAYGLPVVTLALHGQDTIVNEAVGIKCPVINPAETVLALKEAILVLYHDRKRLKKMSRAAYDYAQNQTWEKKIAKVVSEFY
jgi:glycosyltransferase involved in cell wall biosynthesis